MASENSCSVLVTNISPKANEKTVSDFFSFCGKVTNLTLRNRSDGSEAIVTFETEAAAKTALLLTSALIVDRPITVVPHNSGPTHFPESLKDLNEPRSHQDKQQIELEGDQISNRPQPDVPAEMRTKTSVIASIIAAGYTLSTDTVRKAREFDDENQISNRFNTAAENFGARIKEIDDHYQLTKTVEEFSEKVAEKAKIVDSQLHISETAGLVSATVAGTAASVSASVSAGVQNVQAKIQQEPTITSAWSKFVASTTQIGESISSFIAPATNTIKAEVDDIANQSKSLIKERMLERGIVVDDDLRPAPPVPHHEGSLLDDDTDSTTLAFSSHDSHSIPTPTANPATTSTITSGNSDLLLNLDDTEATRAEEYSLSSTSPPKSTPAILE